VSVGGWGQKAGLGLTPGHLELAVNSEVKALIPDRVSAVLDCACLQPVAGGCGQPQSHIAVRRGHCKEDKYPVMAQSPSQPSHPEFTSFYHLRPVSTGVGPHCHNPPRTSS
jgi:hypothetical protein